MTDHKHCAVITLSWKISEIERLQSKSDMLEMLKVVIPALNCQFIQKTATDRLGRGTATKKHVR